MRFLLFTFILLCGLVAADQVATGGQYLQAGWAQAGEQAKAFRSEVDRWVGGVGL